MMVDVVEACIGELIVEELVLFIRVVVSICLVLEL